MSSSSPDTVHDLARATEATAALLEELGLKAYVFEVESHGVTWHVKLEYATEDNTWQDLTIVTPSRLLVRSLENHGVRRELLRYWGERLASCRARRH